MTAVELVRAEIKRLHQMFDTAIADLAPDQLHAVPGRHPKANTIAWGVWHFVRTEDNVIRFILQNRRPTVWQEGGYAERLGLPPVPWGDQLPQSSARRDEAREGAAIIRPRRAPGAGEDPEEVREESGVEQ